MMRKEIKILLAIVAIAIVGICIFSFSSGDSNAAYFEDREITEDADITSGIFGSKTADKNSILANGKINVKLSNVKVNKTGDSSGGDQTSFYGMNSAILAEGGANLVIRDIEVVTDATGANGIFSYGGASSMGGGDAQGQPSDMSATDGGSGEVPEKPPEEGNSSEASAVPEKPADEGNSSNSSDVPEKPADEGNSSQQSQGSQPAGEGSSEADGTTVEVSDSSITTSKDNSGGIMVTGGGVLNAHNLNVKTAGISSAAIRSDRGGGNMTVDGGTYETSGQGSPAIYSTANVVVKNAQLTATASEGAIIEGKNSISLEKVTLTDTNDRLNGQSTTYKNIFIYQSMSGDADVGTAEFNATDSKIITNKGDSIYVTNTNANIYLKNNEFTNNDNTGDFLRIQKDSWGSEGSNGGNVALTMENQKATGNIDVDSISSLNMTLQGDSYYEGTINENSGNTINLHLDKSSKIKLTGDSYISSLVDDVEDYSNIDFNGFKLYVNGEAIN